MDGFLQELPVRGNNNGSTVVKLEVLITITLNNDMSFSLRNLELSLFLIGD
jgi:hypothetical protein